MNHDRLDDIEILERISFLTDEYEQWRTCFVSSNGGQIYFNLWLRCSIVSMHKNLASC
jgi:hypothetical protein